MSSKRGRSYANDCLPVIDIGATKKVIIRDAAFLLDLPAGIAEFERGFHDAYLERYLKDKGLIIIEGEVRRQ